MCLRPARTMPKAYVPIQLDKTRNLRFGMKALSLVEEMLEMPLGRIDLNRLTMKQAATFIWAGLVHEDDSLTPDKVMDLIDEHSSLDEAFRKIGKAIEEAFGKNAIRAAEAKMKNGTGKSL